MRNQTAVGDSKIAENLIDSTGVNAVTFTGSVPQRATPLLKKTVLELGGSDPFIICEDAEKVSTEAVKGRFINCGQSCIASKRFIVVKEVADEFTEKFVQKTEKLKVGDPLLDDADIGPVVNAKSLENMEGIVDRTIKSGAELKDLGRGGYRKVIEHSIRDLHQDPKDDVIKLLNSWEDTISEERPPMWH